MQSLGQNQRAKVKTCLPGKNLFRSVEIILQRSYYVASQDDQHSLLAIRSLRQIYVAEYCKSHNSRESGSVVGSYDCSDVEFT